MRIKHCICSLAPAALTVTDEHAEMRGGARRAQRQLSEERTCSLCSAEWRPACGRSRGLSGSKIWTHLRHVGEVFGSEGVLKNTGVFFEDRGSHTCAPSRAILGRPLPNPCCLMGHRVRRTATPHQSVGDVHRRPPRTLPSKGRGREWATGTGEAAPRRALDPKPRVRTNLTLRWCSCDMCMCM